VQIMSAPSGLIRKSLGTGSLLIFCATASSPMAVLAGGVVATYATTGVIGVPLSFLVLAGVLVLWTVGYLAMSRYLPSAGVFYAGVAHGLGRIWGIVAAPVVLVAYNAIQISLYGLFGAVVTGAVGGAVNWPWWAWSLLAWASVALLGVARTRISAGLLGAVLVVEVAMILLFDAVAFSHPAGGSVSFAPLAPGNLLLPGLGGVFALGIAAFVGYESAPVYAEEAKSHRSVAKATYFAAVGLGLLYAVSAWAMAVAVGADHMVEAARDPSSGLPFVILERHVGPLLVSLATLLIVTSVFAAMISFHNSVARYVFTLGRERVLPAAFARIGDGTGAPIGGSVFQSAVALVMIVLFALSGVDPLAIMFTWVSSIAAIAVMFLMVVSSVATIRFFQRGGGTTESAWQRSVAPALGALAMTAVLLTTVVNISSVLGAEPGSAVVWLVPGAVAFAVVIGIGWAVTLRSTRPDVLANVGRGQPKPLAVIEQDLADLRL
jgi:amino acid transporter